MLRLPSKQMGKAEPTPQRFRRKATGSSAGASEQSSNPSHSSHYNTVDNMLCNNLLDSTTAPSDVGVFTPRHASRLSQGLATTNGTFDAEGDSKGGEAIGERPPSVIRGNGTVTVPAAHTDPDGDEDLSFSSHLPAELSGLAHSDITLLCTHQSLALSACHVQREDAVLLVTFISNSSHCAAQQMQLQMTSGEVVVQLSKRNMNTEFG